MRLSLLAVLALSVATCGQKGPLTMPEPQAAQPISIISSLAT